MPTRKDAPRLMSNSDRLTIVGATGTGKTQAALWHLSKRDFSVMPWVVFDFKLDDHISKLKNAEHVNLDFVPSETDRGIFVYHPLPEQEDEQVEELLWKLWSKNNVGIYVDEGYMIDNPAFNAILTQGRSKHLPVILLSQRPVWLSRFAFSEASFYQIFRLQDKRDEKTIEQFTPINFNSRLPEFHSYYFDVGRNRLDIFSPVPQEGEILDSIDAQIEAIKPKRKRWL